MAAPPQGPLAGRLAEPPSDPEVDRQWTSDRELDRLRPLAAALHSWSEVYERWRHHPLARARPVRAGFGSADLSLLDGLRGIHFGQLTAAAQRWRGLAAASARLAESCRTAGADLAAAWDDAAAAAPARVLDGLRRDAEDCAARCERLGLHLEVAIGDTAVPAVRDAVAEILARCGGFGSAQRPTSPRTWARRVTELERTPGDGSGPREHQVWRGELDRLVIDYDAVVGLVRANLRAAARTLTRIYDTARDAVATIGGQQAAPAAPAGGTALGRPAGTGPAATVPASADPSAAASASSATADAGGGGDLGSDPAGTGHPADPGSARLGELGDLDGPPDPGHGAARLASVSDEDGCATAPDAAQDVAAGGSSMTATAGAAGGTGADDQRRTSRPRHGGR